MGVAVSETTMETQDGHRKRDGEFAEQAAHNAAHQQQRDEHRHQRNAHGDHRRPDFLGPLQGGGKRVQAGFQVARDVLDHHDGVVHHEAGGDGQGHQREVVEAVAEQVHHAEGAQQRDRNRDAGNERAAGILEKHEDHQDHQPDRDEQGPLHVVDGSADGLGLIHGDLQIDGGGNGGVNLRQHGADAVHGVDDVGARLAEDDDQHGRLAVGVAGVAHVFHGIDHVADIGDAHGGAVVIGDEQGLVVDGLE